MATGQTQGLWRRILQTGRASRTYLSLFQEWERPHYPGNDEAAKLLPVRHGAWLLVLGLQFPHPCPCLAAADISCLATESL